VDGHHAAPLVVGELGERVERRRHRPAGGHVGDLLLDARVNALRAARDAGVVDPDVDGSERLLDLGERAVDGRGVGDVGLNGQAAGHVRRHAGRLLLDIQDRHARALPRQPQTGRLADPRAAARDHGDLSFEPHAAPPIPRRRSAPRPHVR
jgi:hypothetical protein